MTHAIESFESVTKRLCLRQWNASDREPFARINADPRVMAFFPRPRRTGERAMADRIESRIAENRWGFWAVERLDSEEFIGFVGLNNPAPELPCSPCVEVGWRLAFEQWGNGYASKRLREHSRWALKIWGFSEIVACTPIENVRSRAVTKETAYARYGRDF